MQIIWELHTKTLEFLHHTPALIFFQELNM
jgi:hypothetical protein